MMADPKSVTQRMQFQIDSWQAVGDRRAVLLGCYQLMTRNMLTAIDAGEFNDPEWVYVLLQHFAEYYFKALEAYEQDPSSTPAVWRLTFDAATQPNTLALQNLLLGINAHINYDLIFTITDMLEPDWAGLGVDERQGRYDDHCHVNRVISRTIDEVQDTIIEPITPSIDLVDKLLGPLDEWAVSTLITRWRDKVWTEAILLLSASGEDESLALRRKFEGESVQRAQTILQILPEV